MVTSILNVYVSTMRLPGYISVVCTVYIGRTDVEYTGKRDQTALFIIFIDILKERFILSRATTHSIDAIKIIIVW